MAVVAEHVWDEEANLQTLEGECFDKQLFNTSSCITNGKCLSWVMDMY